MDLEVILKLHRLEHLNVPVGQDEAYALRHYDVIAEAQLVRGLAGCLLQDAKDG